MSIRRAFDGLGLGWNFDQVLAYLRGSAGFDALGEKRGEVLGMVAAFAIVAVEHDREQHPHQALTKEQREKVEALAEKLEADPALRWVHDAIFLRNILRELAKGEEGS